MGETAGVPYATLLEATRARRAAVRSVSKALGPDLRVALVAADAATTARVEGRQGVGVRWVSFLLQQLVAALWKDRSAQAAQRKAARLYAKRRQAALAALAARGIEARGRSGHNIWVAVPDEASACQGLLEEGWAVAAGARFRMETPPAVRVTVGDLEPRDAERFADALARVLEPPRRSQLP
jgi:DNA-binding transcriptional MocR family regulator